VCTPFPMPSRRGTSGGLRERERQIASAVVVVAVAVAAVVFVVIFDDGVDVNRCVASTSAPVVHVLPGQGRRRRASRGGEVFLRGQRRRWSNPKVSSNDSRLSN
jgi:hypothetical protein